MRLLPDLLRTCSGFVTYLEKLVTDIHVCHGLGIEAFLEVNS